ncbi:MAG: hypothetical protein GY859_24675, partial [Desulfobacterales bacterium]|nr:hypothetical protein [Desulfobacterales bacterium]
MVGLEMLLGAAMGAGLGLIGEAGFGDELGAIKKRLGKESEASRGKAFKQVLRRASENAGLKEMDSHLTHDPFREALVAGLLDPIAGFDIRSASGIYKDELPAHALALSRFFSTLRDGLLCDEAWGPLLNGYQELRFRPDVLEKLQAMNIEIPAAELVPTLNANLDGDGAIAQGRGAAAVGKRGVYITGDVNRGFIVTGDVNTINLIPAGDPGDRRRRYLAELAAAADNLPWA